MLYYVNARDRNVGFWGAGGYVFLWLAFVLLGFFLRRLVSYC